MGAIAFLAIFAFLLIAYYAHLLWIILSVVGVLLAIGGAYFWRSERPKKTMAEVIMTVEDMISGFILGHSLLPKYGPNGEVLPAAPFQPKVGWTHWVVGGVPDAGKSNTLNLLLAKLAYLPEVQFAAIDPKGGLEFKPWEPRLALLATKGAEWTILLDRVITEMNNRMITLGDLGLQKFRPSVEMPWIVLVIDEAAEVFTLDELPKRAQDVIRKVRTIISRGRALGVIVILATQKPDESSIPTSIRDMAAIRIAHQTTTGDMTDTILGRNWRKRVANTVPLDPQFFDQTPGKATTWSRGQVDLVQIDHFPEGSAAKVANETAHLTRRDLL